MSVAGGGTPRAGLSGFARAPGVGPISGALRWHTACVQRRVAAIAAGDVDVEEATMSGQQHGRDSLEREMDKAPDGAEIDLQEVGRAVSSGRVEAEEQPTPEDELKSGNEYARESTTKERQP